MLRIGPARLVAVTPLGFDIADGRIATVVFQHARRVQQVECHEGVVFLGEFIVEAGARSVVLVIAIGRAGACFANPAAIGLWRDRNADVLYRLEHAHSNVFDAVLVARHNGAADFAVKGILALVVGLVRMGIELFNKGLRQR